MTPAPQAPLPYYPTLPRNHERVISPVTKNGGFSRIVRGPKVSESNSSNSTPNQPSFAELAAALKALQTPEPQGFGRHVGTIVVAAALGIGAWVLSGMNQVQVTLVRIDSTVTAMSSTVKDTSQKMDGMTGQIADLKANQALEDQRIKALELHGGGRT